MRLRDWETKRLAQSPNFNNDAVVSMLSLPVRRKVFAYITHQQRLLVFRHRDFPEAGVQVPAGTLESGEKPAIGVLREAWEETGLINLHIVSWLGEQQRDMSDFGRPELHHRTFFHLRCPQQPPEQWSHAEKHASDGGEPIWFDFFWVDLTAVPPLIANHDYFIPTLRQRMTNDPPKP